MYHTHSPIRVASGASGVKHVTYSMLFLYENYLSPGHYSWTTNLSANLSPSPLYVVAMQFRLNLPPLTRVLLIVLCVISIVYQVIRLNGWIDPSFLALIPQWALFRPWVYFTATFAEQNLITLLVAAITLFYGGKYLERAWDSREFGKFVLLVTLIPNLIASLLYVLWFAITRDDDAA